MKVATAQSGMVGLATTQPVVGTFVGPVGSGIGTVVVGEVGTWTGPVGSGNPPEGAMRVGIHSMLG